MRLDSRTGLRGLWIDADTGARIPFVVWGDTETGEYEAWRATPDGRALAEPKQKIKGRARLRFVPAAPTCKREVPPSLCGGTPVPDRTPRGGGSRLSPLAVQECEVRACHRPAAWVVQDWRQVEPERGGDGCFYDRAVLLVRHYFCDWHYRPPVETSRRGVENEIDVQVARPQ